MAIKKDKLETFLSKWMCFESILLSKIHMDTYVFKKPKCGKEKKMFKSEEEEGTREGERKEEIKNKEMETKLL